MIDHRYRDMDLDEILAALDDPDEPTPLPCATEGCNGFIMEYDYESDNYECPLCGRAVSGNHVLKYLTDIVNHVEPEWEEIHTAL